MSALRLFGHTWRSLRRVPVFTATIVLTLTVGIGAATAIFTVVNAVLLRPLPYASPDRLVGVWHHMAKIDAKRWGMTSGMYFTYAQLAHSLESIAAYVDGSESVTDPDGLAEPERMPMAATTANLFQTLGVSPLLGRTYSEAEDVPSGPDVVVISEGLWRSRFAGDRGIIGKKIVISGRTTEIIGVMPERLRFPSADTKLWMPSRLDPNDPYPGTFRYHAVARLAPAVSLAAAQRDLANVLPRLVERFPNHAPGLTTQAMLDQAGPRPDLALMRDDMVGDVARTLWVVAAAAALVLLVTCANVANLLLLRADGRHRELAVRTALGAGRSQVLAQFFAESMLLAGIASVLAVAADVVGVKLLVSAGPAEIPRLAEIHVDAMTIAFTAVVALLVAVACSTIPALRFLHGNPLASLREGGRGGTAGGHRQRARSILVAVQMAFALVVLAGSGMLFRSFQRLHAVKPGFDPENVATLWVSLPPRTYATPASIVRFYANLTQRAANVPGVKSVGITSTVPLTHFQKKSNGFFVEGDATYAHSIPPLQYYVKTDGGYFKTMGIPLIAGRTFGPIVALQQPDEAIISQHTAEQFFHDPTGRSALGKRFQPIPHSAWHTIVGVVGSVRDTSLSAPVTGAVYVPEAVTIDTGAHLPLGMALSPTMALVARTAIDAAAVTRALQALVRELDPTLPTFDARTMHATMERSMARVSFTMVILGVAAGVTLVLGIVGLYGVIAYVVTMRTREIGVRIALGAQPRSVMRMVAKQGLALSLAGVAAGIALSLITARFLRVLLFEVTPSDPIALGGAAATLVALALLASWVPARRAARVDPTESLRAD
jgi:putative ABC transport system permease protein